MSLGFVERSLQLASTVATEKLLRFILSEALEVTQSDVAAIFVLERPHFEGTTSNSSANLTVIAKCHARASLQAASVLNQRSSAILGLREYPVFPGKFPLIPDTRSAIAMPLREANCLLGWLITEHPSPDHYDSQQHKFLQTVAGQSVSALYRSLLRARMAAAGHALDLVGFSPELLDVERKARIAATSVRGSVLITGERGSGKELVAEAIHFLSDRHRHPFLPVLSSSFAEGLFADELFGHERFAFTGAGHERKGKFQAAEGGTVFLDEVGDLHMEVQAGLLRIIERGEVPRIGLDRPLRVDVRVVAATNRDLDLLMEQDKFRRDLYDRLSVFEIYVPPLRTRKQDILPLATHFLRAHCIKKSRNGPQEGCDRCGAQDRVCCARPDLYEALLSYDWPGNVRELAHVMLQLMATYPGQVLEANHLPERIRKHRQSSAAPVALEETKLEVMELQHVIRCHLHRVIGVAKGNKTQAAKLLGLPRSTLNAMLRRYRC